MQTAIRCLFMRGGTSRGPFFLDTRAALVRTARLLMRGEVMVPSAVFEQVCV